MQEDSHAAYQVALDVFEGPLDLLLRLIEREELDVTRVSLAMVADQFLAHVALLKEISAANLADFLAIAAKLLVIKSRALLPRPENQADPEEEDLGEQLARQLLEYKRFKEAASKLREIEAQGLRSYPRMAPPPLIEKQLQPGEVTLDELMAAFKRVLEAPPPMPPLDDVVAPVAIHISDCMQIINERLGRYGRVRFSTLMHHARSRLEVIVTFMAVLEMIKQQRVRALQERPFGEISLEAREPDPDAEIPPTDPAEYGEMASS